MTKLVSLFNYLAKLFVLMAILCLTSDVQAQQGGTVIYGYDSNGRLTSVSLPTGEAVVYTYDPAGNITSIQRVAGAGPQFLSFAPQSGFIGDTVTFNGANFGTVSSVSFNGTNATVFSGNLTQITAVVPIGATTGSITVTLSNGMFSTSTFSVLALQVNPSLAAVLPNQTQQFMAVVPSQLGNTAVTWSVNSINGGNSSVGTISSTGLYTAPNINNSQTFTIRATSVARPDLFALATAKVSSELYQARTSISVEYKKSLIGSQPRVFISITNAPIITSISPNSLAKGSSNSVTVNGSNLSGSSALVFIDTTTGNVDTSITVTNLTVAGDGNSLTATLDAASTAATGNRVVVITGATTGHSTTNNNNSNIISILP